jgi:outer membrane protein TolC
MRTDDLAKGPSRKGGRSRGGLAFRAAAGWLAAGFAVASCSPARFQFRADRETYTALFEKTGAVENVEPESLELLPPSQLELGHLRSYGKAADYLGSHAASEREAKLLTLDEALATGIRQSREYLTEKERVFLSALDLTLARFRLTPIFFADGRGVRATDSRRAELQQGMTDLVSTNTFARTQSGGFNWLYNTGARISADFTQDFLRIMTGNRSFNESDLAVSIAQPLLQGGGAAVTMEALTQEERDVLYQLRDFADYRRAFIVDLVAGYYEVLRARDRVRNAYVAFQGFVKNVEREEALAEEDRRTQTQLGLLRQAKLQAESRWIDSIRVYTSLLDAYKITLGLPVAASIVLDDSELQRLKIEEPPVTKDESVEIALVTRPDLATAADRVEDARRKIKVARNGLLPGLDVTLDHNSVSDPGDSTPAINWNRRRWAGEVDVRLPLNRKAERNIYRASFIALERAERAEDLALDRARFDIFEAWRALEQQRLDFRIAEQGVDLAARRLEEQVLLAELGRGEVRDLVDAQNDLVNSQNQRTSTVINHTLARMRLWRDMGILYIKEDGSWAEKLREERP